MGLILSLLASHLDGFAQFYSENIYDNIVSSIGRLCGKVPFSVVEILLYIFILVAVSPAIIIPVRWIVLKCCRKSSVNLTTAIKKYAACLVLTAGILFFVYETNCGVNYYRTSFSDSTGIRVENYTSDQLAQVCLILTDHVNDYAELVTRDQDGVMYCDDQKVTVYSVFAMDAAGKIYPELQGYYPPPKGLLAPWILSVQKVTGIYSPFTVEANYNTGMTGYNIPFTACHELSHLRGYMKEEEANFIAWLACMESESPEFQYSGALRGWISCMNLLYSSDWQQWKAIRVQLHPNVEADLQANREFWNRYDGKAAQIAEKVNDSYLKANGQSDGIRSYSRMVDLITAYYLLQIT